VAAQQLWKSNKLALLKAPDDSGFLLREQCPKAGLEIIALCHPWEHIERIRRAVPQIGLVQLDDDTVLSAGSFEASLRAAGGAILAVDEVMAGKAKNAFVAIRPAGHHAEATTAMGFCLFNNAAIAIRHAQRRYGAERAAIVDFDAHHRNGSQQIFWSDRTVMYCSTRAVMSFGPLDSTTSALSGPANHEMSAHGPQSGRCRGFRLYPLRSLLPAGRKRNRARVDRQRSLAMGFAMIQSKPALIV
jgi:acetoin utilization deacetylase AcuC-like enzyme